MLDGGELTEEPIAPGLERVAIGGGGHGVNLHLSGADLVRFMDADVADVTRADPDGSPTA